MQPRDKTNIQHEYLKKKKKKWCSGAVLYGLTRADCTVFRNFQRQLLTIGSFILIMVEVFMPQKSVMPQSALFPPPESQFNRIHIYQLTVNRGEKKTGSEIQGSESKEGNEIRYKNQKIQ